MMEDAGKTFCVNKIGETQNILETLGEESVYNTCFHKKILEFEKKEVEKFYQGRSCLVLGPSEEGEIEQDLHKHFEKIAVVDASMNIIKKLQNKMQNCLFFHDMFEHVKIDMKFNTILMLHILEHLDNPIYFLQRTHDWIGQNGRIIVITPNSESIHRLLGVEMGILKNTKELGKSDCNVGHKKVYDLVSLEGTLLAGGYKVIYQSGIMVKPFHNDFMMKLSDQQLKGLYKVGVRFPELCADIMMVCVRKKHAL